MKITIIGTGNMARVGLRPARGQFKLVAGAQVETPILDHRAGRGAYHATPCRCGTVNPFRGSVRDRRTAGLESAARAR